MTQWAHVLFCHAPQYLFAGIHVDAVMLPSGKVVGGHSLPPTLSLLLCKCRRASAASNRTPTATRMTPTTAARCSSIGCVG